MSDYDDAIAENEPFLSEQGATSEAGAGGSSSGSAAASTAAGKGAASGLGAAAGGAAPSLAAVAAVGVMTVAVGIMVAVALSTSHSPHDSGIIRSESDPNVYRHLKLNNGMQVMLVSDTTGTSKGAASMDVHVGQFQDPKKLPGLAHFVEHLLFLGSERFPEEDYFMGWLSSHDGSTNAYTANEDTNFHFSVDPRYLRDALEIWSDFFIAPSFPDNGTKREVTAVNNEYSRHLQSDGMRVMHVLKHTSNELHPFHKFGVGNRDTLQTTPKKEGINVVEEAKKFHSTYYSANLMRLTIMGTQSLDELEGWARGLFRKVPNKHLMSPTAEGNIRTIPVRKQEQMGNLYRVRSLEDQQNLVLQWVIPAQWPNYRSKPAELLTALLGHEGEHSLLSHLKEEGLATAISAGVSFEASDMAWVEVDLTLTDSGYANANAVILAVFHYVGVLQREGLPLWFFQEHKDMGAVNFRYQQRSDELDTVTSISERLQTIDPRFVLVAPYLYERYKPEEFDDLVQQLSPDRLIVVLLAADIKEADLPEQEPWYKTRYAVTPLPNDQLQRWIAVQSGNEPPPKGLAMPDRNSFIPQTFSLLHTPATPFPTAKPKSAPKRVRITPRQWLWHYPDSQYGQPRAVVGLLVATGADVSSPRQRVLLELYASCVRDGFAEAAYPASVAGLSYSLDPARNGLVIRMEGYDDAMPHFAEALGKHMEDFVADEAMVTRLQGQLRRDLSGFRSREPFRQLPRFLDLALSSPDTEPLSLIEATKKDVSVEELDDFAQSLWRASHTEVLVVGNLDRERAEAVADAFEQVQGAEEVNPKDAAVRVRTLHKNRTMAWRMPATTPAQSNSAVAAYFQAGTFSPALRARMQLLQTALREPAFKQLRTKEQLGYVVQVTHLPRHGAEAIAVVVQSDSSDPQYLDNRVELFLDNAGDHLRNMTKAEFKRRVSVLRRDLQMPFDSLTQLFDAWWSQVVEHTYEFNLAHKQDGVLATTKKSDLVKLFETAVHKSSTRRKLSLQIKAQKQDSYTTAQPKSYKDSLDVKTGNQWFTTLKLAAPVFNLPDSAGLRR